jgi:DNA invertase Pin-like site-specific DNA recombinase
VANSAGAAVSSIEAACARSGWKLLEVLNDSEDGRPLERPGLVSALDRIAREEARGLVVTDLHDVTRSITELGALMAWFDQAGATLIALDLGIDTSTPVGRAVASVLVALSRSERERSGGLASNGTSPTRMTSRSIGRSVVTARPELANRIAAMRASHMTLQAIADQLNAEGVPTLRGGAKWRPSSIQAALGYRRPGPVDHLPPLGRREQP